MSADSKIEWTEKTWNPLTGCTHCSPGCDNCYAAREASGRLKSHAAYVGLAVGGKFTGEIRLLPDRLDQPLRWRDPKRVFVNSMSDLFHPDVPDAFIAQVFEVMATCKQHTFQILTKRPQRMARLLGGWSNLLVGEDRGESEGVNPRVDGDPWPLPNVWVGTSVESQRYADMRIPHLLRTPAAVRFLSVEPMLGPVDLSAWIPQPCRGVPVCSTCHAEPAEGCQIGRIDWVIVGGESGPSARPMHPDWARSIRDGCVAAGVPFLFKQWGEWVPFRQAQDELGNDDPIFARAQREVERGILNLVTDPDPKVAMIRVGKKAAGRELDGRTWDEYPT